MSTAKRNSGLGILERQMAEDSAYAGEVLGELLQVLIAESFTRLADRKGLTRAELAERVGCDPSFVSGVLNGTRNITLRTMGRFAVALGALPSLSPSGRTIPLERFSLPPAD